MLRGVGGTRFLSKRTARTANVGVLALDAVDLMDALGVKTFFVAGHDWGSNVAEAVALGWSDRVPRIAMMATPSRLGGLATPSFPAARRIWYQWFQATKCGANAIEEDRKGFARIMWETWSPKGWFDEQTFNAVARSFRNPDWLAITIHSYRSRWGEARFDRRSVKLEERIASTKRLGTPTLFFQGARDGVTPPDGSETMGNKFGPSYERILLRGVGHFIPREAPDLVAERLIRHFAY